MIQVTTEASRHLSDRLPEEPGEDTCFRVVPAAGGNYALRVSTPEQGDVTVQHEGNVILAIEPAVAARLDGWLLDIESRPGGERGLILMPSPPGD